MKAAQFISQEFVDVACIIPEEPVPNSRLWTCPSSRFRRKLWRRPWSFRKSACQCALLCNWLVFQCTLASFRNLSLFFLRSLASKYFQKCHA